jgi:hypothetical protein
LDTLKRSNGLYLTKFYEKCKTSEGRICADSDEFNTNDIIFGEILLINDSMDTLDSFRIPLLEKIIEELNNYFPSHHYKAIEILNPTYFPMNSSGLFFYGISEFKIICSYSDLNIKLLASPLVFNIC